MKIRITFECDDELRRAVNSYYGRPGLADYKEMRRYFYSYGDSVNADFISEYSGCEKNCGQCEQCVEEG